MADHRVVCTEQVPASAHPRNAKIVAVGTGTDPGKASKRWTVAKVVGAIDQGHRFYTQGKASGKIALVEKYWCGACAVWHIRTNADAVLDNNLDSLRTCSWRNS